MLVLNNTDCCEEKYKMNFSENFKKMEGPRLTLGTIGRKVGLCYIVREFFRDCSACNHSPQ